jgi:hypothetical protein
MPQVEKLKIFLASPGDVAKERGYVEQVIAEINRTIAPSKGIILEVVRWEKNTFPGYGKDAQALINEQIARMKEYELFVGIMWNRVGTKTPRAESGTIEEFERAVTAFKRKGQPEIWFYFRQSAARLDTEEQLEQRRKVLVFKRKVQRNAMPCNYTTPSNFRDLFRTQLTLWLNKRENKTPPRTAVANQSKKLTVTHVKPQPPTTTVSGRKRPASTASTVKEPSPAASRSTTRAARSVSDSGAWVFLNQTFFLTNSVVTQANQSIVIRISPSDSEQEAALRALQPTQFQHRKQIAYAYQNDAAIMQVESVLSESIAGKTIVVLTLKPEQGLQGSNSTEMNVNGYSADQIAELRARLLLLNETLPNQRHNNSFLTTYFISGYDSVVKIEKGIFPNLWGRLKTQPKLFLLQARLAAVYYLKMSCTVEHILELKLGPIKNGVMPVLFRGRRKQDYINQIPAVIEVVGNCHLDA